MGASSSPGVVRASSIFPILSAVLLLLGGVCVACSSFYKSKRNIVLGGGILFVAAGEKAADCVVFLKRNVNSSRIIRFFVFQLQSDSLWGFFVFPIGFINNQNSN